MHFKAIPTHDVHDLRAGAPDAHGNPAERVLSDGGGNPCRHCLKDIPKGAEMLVLAYQPFDANHAYAETGPIFLCANDCDRGDSPDVPEVLQTSPDYLIKGYSADERIVYGTGTIAPAQEIAERLDAIFADPNVAFIHVRSARNNCFQARVDRVR